MAWLRGASVFCVFFFFFFNDTATTEIYTPSLHDALSICFYYTISFGGFVGLASSYVLYFRSEFGLPPVHAGDLAAICTAAGALLRPVGGATADRIGGIRALYFFYTAAGMALVAAALGHVLWLNTALLVIASGALGMANGS